MCRADPPPGRTSPHAKSSLRALIGAALLGEGKYGISTMTAAALCTGVSRSMLYAALILLQSEDESLIVEVLKGHKGVQSAAAKVHGRAKLIEGFRTNVEDRAAFGHAVGVGRSLSFLNLSPLQLRSIRGRRRRSFSMGAAMDASNTHRQLQHPHR